ncbi:MAG: hypothetical protein ACT4ON_07750 [Bacteroidota bacterium]
MKKIITYSLLILVMAAFNFKGLDYFFNITDSSITYVYDCEEKNSESEESNEKDEKKEVREYLFEGKADQLTPSAQLSFKQHSKLLYLNSDYSLGVYSPPEQL